MNISSLIEKLEEFKEKYGDIPVLTKQDGFGGYGIYDCDGVREWTVHPYEFSSGGENGQITKRLTQRFFPEWDGVSDDTLESLNNKKCVCLCSGTLIYAS
jgi:hypothetical protein